MEQVFFWTFGITLPGKYSQCICTDEQLFFTILTTIYDMVCEVKIWLVWEMINPYHLLQW